MFNRCLLVPTISSSFTAKKILNCLVFDRRLPSLSSTFIPTGPVDNPALHQGRVRTTPHVEGQYAAYVYVPIQLGRKSKLLALLRDIYLRAKELAPTLHPIGFSEVQDQDTANGPAGHKAELHVSLSRPIYLRAHQRDELKRAVRSIARARQPYVPSYLPQLRYTPS